MHVEDIVKVVAMIFVSCGVEGRKTMISCFQLRVLFFTEPTINLGIVDWNIKFHIYFFIFFI